MPLDSGPADLVGQWIEKADADLKAAELLSASGASGLTDIIGFYYLKAVLPFHQVEFLKTHDIRALVELLPAHFAESEPLQEADWLTPFGVRARYPIVESRSEAADHQRAFALARSVQRLVLARVTPLAEADILE
jgi:HEPN domain-containing protein